MKICFGIVICNGPISSIVELSDRETSVFLYLDENFSKYQWIFTKFVIAFILWRSALEISLIFDSYRPATGPLININEFSPNFVCASVNIMGICFGIAYGRVSCIYLTVTCPQYIRILLSAFFLSYFFILFYFFASMYERTIGVVVAIGVDVGVGVG